MAKKKTDTKVTVKKNVSPTSGFTAWSNSKQANSSLESWANGVTQLAQEASNYYQNYSTGSESDKAYQSFRDRAQAFSEAAGKWKSQYGSDAAILRDINSLESTLHSVTKYAGEQKNVYNSFANATEYNNAVEYQKNADKWSKQYSAYNYKQLVDRAFQVGKDTDEGSWLLSKSDDIASVSDYEDYLKILNNSRSYSQTRKGNQILDDEIKRVSDSLYGLRGETKYGNLSANADYASNSAVTATGKTAKAGVRVGNAWIGSGDKDYDYINNLDGTKDKYERDRTIGRNNSVDTSWELYRLMDDQQISNYNYIYNTEGEKAAKEYLDYLTRTDLSAKLSGNRDAARQQLQDSGKVGSFLASVGSVPATLLSGAGYLNILGQNVRNDFVKPEDYRPVNYNDSALEYSKFSTNVRSYESQRLMDKYGAFDFDVEEHPVLSKVLNGKSVADIYQGGMSILDSTALATVSPFLGPLAGWGTVLLGGSAATNGILDAVSKGANDREALAMGTLNGLFETLFEYVSLDKLMHPSAHFLKNLISSAFVEGSEEVATDIANFLGNLLVMGDKSDLNVAVTQYMQNGMSKEDAYKKALLEQAVDTFWSFVGGFWTGGVMGGANSGFVNFMDVVRNFNDSAQYAGKQTSVETVDADGVVHTTPPPMSSLIDEVLELDPNNRMAKNIQKKLDDHKRIKRWTAANMLKESNNVLGTYDQNQIAKAAEQRLTELGETGDVSKLSKLIARQAIMDYAEEMSETGIVTEEQAEFADRMNRGFKPDELTMLERRTLEKSPIAQRVLSELTMAEGDMASDWTGSIGTDVVRSEQYNRNTMSDEERKAIADYKAAAERAGARIENEVFKANSETVAQNTEKSEEYREPTLEELSKKYGKQAPAMMSVYNSEQNILAEKQSPKLYDYGFETVYGLAKAGVNKDYIMKSEAAQYLTENQRETAYKIGVDAATETRNAKTAEISSKANENATWKPGTVKSDGVKIKDLNRVQKDAYKVFSNVAQVTGLNIVLYSSETDAEGNFKGEQGRYDHNDPKTVYIDINAGLMNVSDASDLAKFTLARTFAHEFTHFIENWNAAEYDILRSMVFDRIVEKGMKPEDLIYAKMAAQEGLSYENASREVVADAMTDILPESSFIEQLANEHQNLFQKLLEKFKEFVAGIKAHFAELANNNSPEARLMKDEVNGALKYCDDIIKAFDAAAKGAVENMQATNATSKTEANTAVEAKTETESSTDDVQLQRFNTMYEKLVRDSLGEGNPAAELVDEISKSEDPYAIKKYLESKTPEELQAIWNDLSMNYEQTKHIKYLENYVKAKGIDTVNDSGIDYSKAEYMQAWEYAKQEEALAEQGVVVDAESDSAVLTQNSVRTLLDPEQATKAAKQLAKRFGVTEEYARNWIAQETSIASIILNPRYQAYLDFEADPNENSVKKNSDYKQGTLDFSSICKKRREFTKIMNDIMRRYPDHVFQSTDLAKIRSIMSEEGLTVACGLCYVEDRRQHDTRIANGFITALQNYRNGIKLREDGKPFSKKQDEALRAVRKSDYVPTVRELTTLEGMNELREKDRTFYNAWVKYNNARGMQSIRMLTNEAEYDRQFLDLTPAQVKFKNDLGGMRIYSFSDMEMFHLLDVVQAITDGSAVGLMFQGYTKVNEYAYAMRNTGLKLNRSLIPAGDLGYHIDKNGNVVLDYDTTEGIDINSKDFFDATDNPDIGNILIGINPTQIRQAMQEEFVTQIIPFHTGQSKDVLKEKGIGEWVNAKNSQTERSKATGNKVKNGVNFYTEVIQVLEKEGKEVNKWSFTEKFLEVCEKRGLTPRFDEYLNHDENGKPVYTEGYYKLLVDFKMFDQKTGKYLPQTVVRPDFDMDYILGYTDENGKKHQGILQRYVSEQKKSAKDIDKRIPTVVDRISKEIVEPAAEESNTVQKQIRDAFGVVSRGFNIDDSEHANSEDILSRKINGIALPVRNELLYNASHTGERLALTRYSSNDKYNNAYATVTIGTQEFIPASEWEERKSELKIPAGSMYEIGNASGMYYYPFYGLEVVSEEHEVSRDINGYPRFTNKPLKYYVTDADDNGVFVVKEVIDLYTEGNKENKFLTRENLRYIYGMDDVELGQFTSKIDELTEGWPKYRKSAKGRVEIFEFYVTNGDGITYIYRGTVDGRMHGEVCEKAIYHDIVNEVTLQYEKQSEVDEAIHTGIKEFRDKPGGYDSLDDHSRQLQREGSSGYTGNLYGSEAQNKARRPVDNQRSGGRTVTEETIDELLLELDISSLEDLGITYEDLTKPISTSTSDLYDSVFGEDEEEVPPKKTTFVEGYVEDGNSARMKNERLEGFMHGETSKSRANYWVTSINPSTFLAMTLGEENQNRDRFDTMPGEYDSTVNDYDFIEGGLKTSSIAPYLNIDPETMQVVGHEGRHRMRALEKAGITNAEIAVQFFGNKSYNFKDGRVETLPSIEIINQFGTGQYTELRNIIPANMDHREELLSTYGENVAKKNDIQYQARVNLYDEAVRTKNQDLAYSVVRSAAYNSGYTEHAYHGTPSFGFTEFGDGRGDSKGLIYATTMREVAANYAGRDNYAFVRPIGKKLKTGNSVSDVIHNANQVLGREYHVATDKEKLSAATKIIEEAKRIADKIDGAYTKTDGALYDAFMGDYDDYYSSPSNDYDLVSNLFFTLRDGDGFNDADFVNGDGSIDSAYISDLQQAVEWFEGHYDSLREFVSANYERFSSDELKEFRDLVLRHSMYDNFVDVKYKLTRIAAGGELITDGSSFRTSDELNDLVDSAKDIGAYDLYVNPGDRVLVVDNGPIQDWLSLKVPEIDNKYHSTDYVGKWAKEHGYTSVLVKNVQDGGTTADEYILFDKSQVKSADAFTYDDEGEIIPLNERFKKDKSDIRYQVRNTGESFMNYGSMSTEKLDAEYEKAIKDGDTEMANQMVAYAAEKAGYKIKGFHGTLSGGFTVFDKSHAHVGGNSGAGFYFSSSIADSTKNYSEVTGADNWIKADKIAYAILDEGEYDGEEVTDYGHALSIARKIINKKPTVYEVYLKSDKPYYRDFRFSTNIFEDIMEDYDESMVSREDYDNNEDYEDELYRSRYDFVYETLYSALYGAINDLEDQYDVVGNFFIQDMMDKIAQDLDMETLTFKGIEDAVSDFDVSVDFDGDFADASPELTRLIIENLGYDAIIDKEVSRKFNQLKEMDEDVEHIIVFKPSQIKSADYYTEHDVHGYVVPLSQRFNMSNPDIRYQQRTYNVSNRDILRMASDNLDRSEMTAEEIDALDAFNEKLAYLDAQVAERQQLGKLYHDQMFSKPQDKEGAEKTRERMKIYDERVRKASIDLLSLQNKDVLKRVLEQSRKVIERNDRARFNDQLKRYRDKRLNAQEIKKYKDRIAKDVGDMSKWILNPSNKNAMNNVPAVLRKPVLDMLTSIDMTSHKLSNHKMHKGEVTQKDQRILRTVTKLKDVLSNVVTNPATVDELYSGYLDLPDNFIPQLNKTVDAMQTLADNFGQFTVANMTSDELKVLSEIVTTLKTSIQKTNRFLQNGFYSHIAEAGDATIAELDRYKATTTNKLTDALLWQQIRPVYGWERFGEAGKAIFKGIVKGQEKLAFNAMEIEQFAEDTYTSKEAKEWSEKTITVKLSGNDVKMTIAQAMGLYELSKRKQGLQHILGGGVRIATFKDGKTKIADAGNHVSESDLKSLESKLTPRQKEVADKMQKFMAEYGREKGNYVSVARFGVEQFTDPDYYPVASDGRLFSAKADEAPSAAALYAMLNMSFTKMLNPDADNRVVIYNIFDVFANHTSSVAQYNAFALPVLDTIKWLNYQQVEYDIDGTKIGVNGTVRDSMQKAFGSAEESARGTQASYAEKFVVNMIKSLNGTESQGDRYDGTGMKALHTFNMAQIAYNARVVVQQPMAITRAAMVLSPKSISKAMSMPQNIKKNVEEACKKNGIAAWKIKLGYYDVNISTGMADKIRGTETFMDKVGNVGMAGAEFADNVTWGTLWGACKEEVISKKHLHPSDGQKFYDAVSNLFNDVIIKTQVVDSVMTKSEFMRSKGFFARSVSSFMSEPVTTASMLINAFDKFRMAKQAGMTNQQAWKRNGSLIARTAAVYAVSQILMAAVTAAFDTFRDDDEYETWTEKWQQAFNQNVIDELLPFNKLPILSDFYDLAKTLLSKFGVDTYGFGPNTVYMQYYDNLAKGFEILSDKINGEDTNYTYYGMTYKLLQAASGITGLPLANVSRDVAFAWNTTIGSMAPSLRLKTYDAGPGYSVKNAFNGGTLSEDEAIAKLVETGVSEDANAAYWKVQGWKAGVDNYSKYSRLDEILVNGGDTKDAIAELTAHGVKEKTVLTHIKSKIGDMYRATDEDVADGAIRISRSQAESLLGKYLDLDKYEVHEITQSWTSFIETGYNTNEYKEAFMEDEITRQQAIDWKVKYAGADVENAEKAVAGWEREKASGYEEKSDIEESYLKGKINSQQARTAFSQWGYSSDEVDEAIELLDFKKSHKDAEDITYKQMQAYKEYGEGNGIPVDQFVSVLEFKSHTHADVDANGNAIQYSLMYKVIDYIDSLPLSTSQKDAMFLMNYAQSNLKYVSWR